MFGNSSYSYDSDNYTYETDVCNYQTTHAFERVFMPLFYSLIFLLGLCGNGIVLTVLLRAKGSLAGTDIFILNLAVADLLLVVTLPFWTVQAVHSWVFGDFLCKLVGGILKINFYSSIFFLVCISFDRYLSIVYVIRMYNRNKRSLIHLSALAVWVLCILFTVPDFLFLVAEFDTHKNITTCSLTYASSSPAHLRVVVCILNQVMAFVLPLLAMTYCYIRIILTLLRSKGFQKYKTLRVILAVVVVFFLTWTPYHLVEFVKTLNYLEILTQDCAGRAKVTIAAEVTSSLGLFHCCLNPLLYAFIGVKFRNRFLELLAQVGCLSHEFLKKHTRLVSRAKDSNWSESTGASYSGF